MKKFILICSIGFNSINASAQQVVWQKLYDSLGIANRCRTFIELNDSGFLLAGFILKPQTPYSCALAMHLNKNGDSLWTKTYGCYYESEILSMTKSSDSTFMCTRGFQYNSSLSDFNVGEINLNGDTLRTHYYLDSTFYFQGLNRIKKCLDGGYIMVGPGYPQADLYKIDSNLNVQWTKLAVPFDIYNIFPDNDSNYIIIGGYAAKYKVLKLDKNGNTLWFKTWGNMPIQLSAYNVASDLIFMSDSNYLIATDGDDWGLMKLNKNTGDTLWTHQYCTTYNPNCNGSGGGIGNVADAGNNRFFCVHQPTYYGILLVDGTNGDTLWTKPLGLGGLYNSTSLQLSKTSDGGFAYLGSTPGYTLFVKFDSLGNTAWTSVIDNQLNEVVSVFPNPTSDYINFSLPADFKSDENLFEATISNFSGQQLLKQLIKTDEPIDVSKLPNGIYIAELHGNSKVVRGKVVVQH